MHPPEQYVQAVREATAHLQLAIEGVELSSGRARLSGTVVRVFRGDPARRGTRLSLDVPCRAPDRALPPGASARFSPDALRAGRVLEALLDDGPDGPEIPLELCTLLDAPTDVPQLRLDYRAPPRRRLWPLLAAAGAAVAAAAYLLGR
jgi:hypothetical protein